MSPPPPPRRFWPPRFSLRGLLLTMTLLCLVFAPLLPELNRSRRIARQVKLIEEMGGECVLVDRPPSFYASLVQRVWPMKITHIEHDLLMAEFNAQTVDLARLCEATAIRGVCFNECLFVVPDDAPDVQLPRIEYVQLQERDDTKGGQPDPAILRRFPAFLPNLRKAQLMGVPQEQEFIDTLAGCKRLEDLDLWFRPSSLVIDPMPLGMLTELRRLRVPEVRSMWNWEFLARLKNLTEIDIGSEQQPVVHYQSESRDQTLQEAVLPSQALNTHKRLRSLTLYESSPWITRLRKIAKNNDLEYVCVDGRGFTNLMLEALGGEGRLRSLGIVPIRDDSERVFAGLRLFPELRELEIHFVSLTDDDLRRLSELKSLERIVLSIDPHNGGVSSEGIELFRKLPITEVRLRNSGGLSRAEGMDRLVAISLLDGGRSLVVEPGSLNVIGRRPPDIPIRQTDEGLRFLQTNAGR